MSPFLRTATFSGSLRLDGLDFLPPQDVLPSRHGDVKHPELLLKRTGGEALGRYTGVVGRVRESLRRRNRRARRKEEVTPLSFVRPRIFAGRKDVGTHGSRKTGGGYKNFRMAGRSK